MKTPEEALNRARKPSLWLALLEARVALDVAAMGVAMGASLLSPSRPAARARERIIVLPGFGADDRATWPLRRHLARQGWAVEGWGLGLNQGGMDAPHGPHLVSAHWGADRPGRYRGELAVPCLVDRFIAQARARHAATGDKLILVGWSLGGYVAREAARELPDIISQVITLGTPAIGGPLFTALADRFRAKGTDIDWIARQTVKRQQVPISQPLTVIWSRLDGVVDWRAARDGWSPRGREVEVTTSHLGLCFSPKVWREIDVALARG